MSTTRDTRRPQRFLVDRMRSIEGLVTETVHEQVMGDGATDLSVAHARVLAELGAGARPSDLAQRLGVTKGAISQLVDRLVARGYVTREPDPLDRRALVLRPTARTEGAYRVSRKALIDIEKEWRSLLGPERLLELETTLQLLDGWRPARPTAKDG